MYQQNNMNMYNAPQPGFYNNNTGIYSGAKTVLLCLAILALIPALILFVSVKMFVIREIPADMSDVFDISFMTHGSALLLTLITCFIAFGKPQFKWLLIAVGAIELYLCLPDLKYIFSNKDISEEPWLLLCILTDTATAVTIILCGLPFFKRTGFLSIAPISTLVVSGCILLYNIRKLMYFFDNDLMQGSDEYMAYFCDEIFKVISYILFMIALIFIFFALNQKRTHPASFAAPYSPQPSPTSSAAHTAPGANTYGTQSENSTNDKQNQNNIQNM
ncbi:MAG: hypothetical protein II998_00380 [Clostridia bacterium]|nr:hypothetical protein [Clostridia bacterium]